MSTSQRCFGVKMSVVSSRAYMHWTAVSAARGASRAPELAAKVTSAEEVLPTSSLRATGMELPNIETILAVNKTVYFNNSENFPKR